MEDNVKGRSYVRIIEYAKLYLFSNKFIQKKKSNVCEFKYHKSLNSLFVLDRLIRFLSLLSRRGDFNVIILQCWNNVMSNCINNKECTLKFESHTNKNLSKDKPKSKIHFFSKRFYKSFQEGLFLIKNSLIGSVDFSACRSSSHSSLASSTTLH